MNPHGQEEAHDEAERLRHRAAAELAGIGRGGRRRLESPDRGLGLGHNRVRKRVRGGQLGRAGPVKPTRVDLTSGPRLSALVLILIKI
jgi:hypothetical protein